MSTNIFELNIFHKFEALLIGLSHKAIFFAQSQTEVSEVVIRASGEFFADIALCPLEATRIRLVSEPTFASGLIGGFSKIAKTEGFGAFYSGFGPILFKQ